MTAEEWSYGMLKGVLMNKVYWARTAMMDMVTSEELFPKGVQGDIEMLGGVRFTEDEQEELEEYLKAFIWFSYRIGFAGLSDYTYDTAWGCVHRTGQMMMVTTLKRHYKCTAAELLHHFKDDPVSDFSIQKIALKGGHHGKPPGQWFAPTTIARVLKDLVQLHTVGSSSRLSAIVADDRTISRPELLSAASSSSGVLLMIPVMLGMEPPMENNYADFFFENLTHKYSVGILGGRPRHALYIIGHKGGHAVVLDPHRVQNAFLTSETAGSLTQPRKISVSVSDMDTCCLFCYYVNGTDEAQELLDFLESSKPARMPYSYFTVVDSKRPVFDYPTP
eukprot:TRINITY_DN1091_c0_g3_i1.p1 TRINITY_DN1091_c0_g3~~TRINITY_DN1091_c0_g3_i1.p1  ORF type:complete len:334 (+),score=45.72 TRINITY_DN1091_c0_g3_i1:35-1036(+)